MVAMVTTPLSYSEFCELPDDDRQYELVEGIPIVNPSPNTLHQLYASRLLTLLAAAAPPHLEVLVSPLDWVLRSSAPALVRQPDLVVLERAELARLDGWADGIHPVLAIEVLSPWSHERDLVHKRREYAEAGCPHFWVGDPTGPSLVIFALRDGRFEEIGGAVGSAALRVSEPFDVEIVPATLVDLDS